MGNIQNRFFQLPDNPEENENERADEVNVDVDLQPDNLNSQNEVQNSSAEYRDDDLLYFGSHAFPINADVYSFPLLHRLLNMTPPTKKTKTLNAPMNLIRTSLKLLKTSTEGVYITSNLLSILQKTVSSKYFIV